MSHFWKTKHLFLWLNLLRCEYFLVLFIPQDSGRWHEGKIKHLSTSSLTVWIIDKTTIWIHRHWKSFCRVAGSSCCCEEQSLSFILLRYVNSYVEQNKLISKGMTLPDQQVNVNVSGLRVFPSRLPLYHLFKLILHLQLHVNGTLGRTKSWLPVNVLNGILREISAAGRHWCHSETLSWPLNSRDFASASLSAVCISSWVPLLIAASSAMY